MQICTAICNLVSLVEARSRSILVQETSIMVIGIKYDIHNLIKFYLPGQQGMRCDGRKWGFTTMRGLNSWKVQGIRRCDSLYAFVQWGVQWKRLLRHTVNNWYYTCIESCDHNESTHLLEVTCGNGIFRVVKETLTKTTKPQNNVFAFCQEVVQRSDLGVIWNQKTPCASPWELRHEKRLWKRNARICHMWTNYKVVSFRKRQDETETSPCE